jgi:flagellar biosynthetic protein FliR
MLDVITGTTAAGNVLLATVIQVLWLSLRVGGVMMAAPMIGTRAMPMRIRLILVIALSIAFAPLLPAPPTVTAVDAALVLAVARELAVGISIGLVFRLAFETGSLAGELIAQGMGLSFAQMANPIQGVNSGIVGQWFYAAFALVFLAFDGHLRMIEILFQSYVSAPVGQAEWSINLAAIPLFLTDVLLAAVRIALPIMIAMLTTNLAFGVLARTAPAFNPFSVGFPAALSIGLILLVTLTGRLVAPIAAMFELAFQRAASLVL